MPLEFEWDAAKAASNAEKHGVSFGEAATTFGDPLSVSIPDPGHSEVEDRWIHIGLSHAGRTLVTCFVDRDDRIRIISSRPATKRERQQYEQGHQ